MKNLKIGKINTNNKYSLIKEVKSAVIWGLSYGGVIGLAQSAFSANNLTLKYAIGNMIIDAVIGATCCGSYAFIKNYEPNEEKKKTR